MDEVRPLVMVSALCSLQCFDTVGSVAGRSYGISNASMEKRIVYKLCVLMFDVKYSLKPAAHGSVIIQDVKKSPKIAIWVPSHNFVRLYLCN